MRTGRVNEVAVVELVMSVARVHLGHLHLRQISDLRMSSHFDLVVYLWEEEASVEGEPW